jgi:hypothetical protein
MTDDERIQQAVVETLKDWSDPSDEKLETVAGLFRAGMRDRSSSAVA